MKFNKKNIINLFFVILLLLFFIPNTRGIMQIFLTRTFSMSPSVIDIEERKQLSSYDWELYGINTESINVSSVKGKVVLIPC